MITKDKLKELKIRALARKYRMGCNVPDNYSANVSNQNFRDLEYEVSSTIK